MKPAVLDLETDPFEYGVVVQPFLSGFYDGEKLVSFWSDDCIDKLVSFLEKQDESYTIYAHNGGRFDFFYFMKYLTGDGRPGHDMRIINGRIVQARLGKHILRDSYAIMPFPLADFDKDSIDYELMRREVRNDHREQIMKYFRKDLTSLHELVTAFLSEFGDKLTIGSASMRQLKDRCPFKCGGKEYDEKWRKEYYFGGRNQVFKGGIIEGDINVYDVNSMYPHVMSSVLHPIGITHNISKRVEENTVFVVAEGHNYGAFPKRQPNNSLDFGVPFGTFYTTIHEWQAALETGSFKPTRIVKTYGWTERATFEEFVGHFYDARKKAKKEKDAIRTLFYKYVLNSAYGKFAQNPENYFDWFITGYDEHPPEWHECTKSCEPECTKTWVPAYVFESTYIIWKRPLSRLTWYNIATGASITGAARAVLLRGIFATREPLYCDTDSIIARGSSGVSISDSRLGGWKHETSGRLACIAGKKMYAIFDPNVEAVAKERLESKLPPPEIIRYHGTAMALVKKAHKGARLTGSQLLKVAQGETITHSNPVPSFSWDGSATFTQRKIKGTLQK